MNLTRRQYPTPYNGAVLAGSSRTSSYSSSSLIVERQVTMCSITSMKKGSRYQPVVDAERVHGCRKEIKSGSQCI